MAYSTTTGSPDAASALEDSGETPPETSEPSTGKSFFIPSEYQDDAIANAKPGDVVKIRIIGKDADGAVEAEIHNEDTENVGQEDWQTSLENAMPESVGGKMKMKGSM